MGGRLEEYLGSGAEPGVRAYRHAGGPCNDLFGPNRISPITNPLENGCRSHFGHSDDPPSWPPIQPNLARFFTTESADPRVAQGVAHHDSAKFGCNVGGGPDGQTF